MVSAVEVLHLMFVELVTVKVSQLVSVIALGKLLIVLSYVEEQVKLMNVESVTVLEYNGLLVTVLEM